MSLKTRTFDGVDDRITVAIGGLNFIGAFSAAFLLNKNGGDGGTRSLIYIGTNLSGTDRNQVYLTAGNLLNLQVGTNSSASTFTVLTAEDWLLLGISTAGAGATPRFHKYVCATSTWTHQAGSAAVVNGGIPFGADAYIGAFPNAGNPFNGDIAAETVWHSDLSDANFEALVAPIVNWPTIVPTPTAFWMLDQDSVATPIDDTVGTSDQTAITGTAVSTSLPLPQVFYGLTSPPISLIATARAAQRAANW